MTENTTFTYGTDGLTFDDQGDTVVISSKDFEDLQVRAGEVIDEENATYSTPAEIRAYAALLLAAADEADRLSGVEADEELAEENRSLLRALNNRGGNVDLLDNI